MYGGSFGKGNNFTSRIKNFKNLKRETEKIAPLKMLFHLDRLWLRIKVFRSI